MQSWIRAAREAAFICRALGLDTLANELHTSSRQETILRVLGQANAAADAILAAAKKGLAHGGNPPLEAIHDRADELLTLSHDGILAIEAEIAATEEADAERDASDRALALVMGESDDDEDLEF